MPGAESPAATDAAAPAPRPLQYHQILRAGLPGAWRAMVGVVVLVLGMFVVGPIVIVLGFVAYFLTTGGDVYDRFQQVVDTSAVTPGVLLFVNLTLIVAIPITWFCVVVLHGIRPRWLASVAPRIRWRWFAASLGVAVVSLVVAILVGALMPSSGGGDDLSGPVNSFTSTTRDFVLVVVLFTPLQAAAEEYAFRGYLTQAFGALVSHARTSLVIAVVAPAVLFALAHGIGQSLPIFFDRFAFGIAAGILAIVTGGLEAGIAYHVVNNVLAYTLALTYGDMTSALNPTGGSWFDVLVSLLKSVIFVGLTVVLARRMGVRSRTDPTVLVPPRPRV